MYYKHLVYFCAQKINVYCWRTLFRFTVSAMDIESHFIKDPDFRTVLVSGVFGGVLGNGVLNISLFTERLPIPQKMTLDLRPDGTIEEKAREGKLGLIREVQIGLLMDLSTTEAIHAFLGSAIEEQKRLLDFKKEV